MFQKLNQLTYVFSFTRHDILILFDNRSNIVTGAFDKGVVVQKVSEGHVNHATHFGRYHKSVKIKFQL